MNQVMKDETIKKISFEDFLKCPNLRIASIEDLLEKINLIKQDGLSKSLQVLIDFDRTLSSHTLKNGERNVTSYECFMKHCDKNEILHQKEKELRDKYIPIEFSKELTAEQKIPLMIEWWSETNRMIIDAKIHFDQVKEAVAASNISYREGFDTFFDIFFRSNIPVMIGTAGLGDIAAEALKMWNMNFPNVEFASNFFVKDENGLVCDFADKLIHSYNKETVYDLRKDFFDENKDRKNILLFGDSLGDVKMLEKISYASTVIKVGFLNFDIEKNLESYLGVYDIVVLSPNSCKELMYLVSVLSY